MKYETRANLDYFQRGVLIRHVRLVAHVAFETREGWTEFERGIVDTGGLISIIPRRIWESARHGFYSHDEIQIRVGGQLAVGKLGQVTLRIHDAEDGRRISPPLTLKANLLSDDTFPVALGFEDFLTNVTLYSDFPQQEAFLIFPSTLSEP